MAKTHRVDADPTIPTSEINSSGKTRAQQLAREAADRYFAAIASAIPFDTAPGRVDLIAASCDIQEAILADRPTRGDVGDDAGGFVVQAALDAGYLLGIEIGRRIGGAR